MNNHIRVRRTGRGWTQAELGDLVGVSRQTINAIEAGRHDPSLTLAFSLADVLEERIDALFVPDGAVPRAPGVDDGTPRSTFRGEG